MTGSELLYYAAGAITFAVFFLDALTLLYDYRLSERGIEFVLFRKIPVGLITFEEISEIRLARPWSALLSAVNYMNRFRYMLRPILVVKKRGAVYRAILLTPRDPYTFLQVARRRLESNKPAQQEPVATR